MTVGRSEAANTWVALFDEKVRSAKGIVPRETFFLSVNSPVVVFNVKFKRCPSPRAHSR